jgi:hypothetical protein
MSGWHCLTPAVDEQGRRLSTAERLSEVARELDRLNDDGLDELAAQLEADDDLTIADRARMLAYAKTVLAERAAAVLAMIAARLEFGNVH